MAQQNPHGPASGSAEHFLQEKKIRKNFQSIRYPIIVTSGKGGVGKSTVSVNIAQALAAEGFHIGLLDVDIHGPNIPKMLGIEDKQLGGTENELQAVRAQENFIVASLGLLGYSTDEAIIWRGPIKIGLIRQLLADIVWGELDYLIVDTPPGTGDEILTLAQTIPNLAGAVVVTTPQDVAILDVKKTLNFAQKLKVHVLGIVENMSGFVCPCCGTTYDLFGSGGGLRLAEERDIAFLGSVPIEAQVGRDGDGGIPTVISSKKGPASTAFHGVVSRLKEEILKLEKAGTIEAKKIDPNFQPER